MTFGLVPTQMTLTEFSYLGELLYILAKPIIYFLWWRKAS